MATKKGGNSRKIGRSLDRPSNKAYKATNRVARNKARNIARAKKLEVKAKAKKLLRKARALASAPQVPVGA